MYPITSPRILAPYILTSAGIAKLSTVEVEDNRVTIATFTGETYATRYIPTPVAILREGALDEYLLDDLTHLMHLYTTAPDTALAHIHTLLTTARLYHTPETPTPPLLLALTTE